MSRASNNVELHTMMHKRAVVTDAHLLRTNRFIFFAPFMRCVAFSICFTAVSNFPVQESNSECGVFLWPFMSNHERTVCLRTKYACSTHDKKKLVSDSNYLASDLTTRRWINM